MTNIRFFESVGVSYFGVNIMLSLLKLELLFDKGAFILNLSDLILLGKWQ